MIERRAKSGSMSRRPSAAATTFGQVRTLGAVPVSAVVAVRRKLLIDTPGTSTGYCMARNNPARARSSTANSLNSTPSRRAEPPVMTYFG